MKALHELVSSGMKWLDSLLLKVFELIFGYLLGAVQPIVDSVYDFDDVHKAYDRILSSRATGKVVVKVDATVDWVLPV